MIEIVFKSVLFTSIVEEILLLFIVLLVLGKKEYLNIKNKSYGIKMVVALTLTTLFSVLFYNYTQEYGLMVLVRILYFVGVYCLTYKLKFVDTFVAFFISLVFYILTEYIGMQTMVSITGISYEAFKQHNASSGMLVAFVIPSRILQIVAIIVLYKIKFVVIDFIFRRNKELKNESIN